MGFGGEGEASFRKYAIRNTFARLRYRNYRYFVRERIVGPTTQFPVDPSAAAGRTTYGTSSTYSLLSSARNRFRTRTKRSAVRKREQRTVRKSLRAASGLGFETGPTPIVGFLADHTHRRATIRRNNIARFFSVSELIRNRLTPRRTEADAILQPAPYIIEKRTVERG